MTDAQAALPLPLETPLHQVRGVGAERASQLARLKCQTVEDLLWLEPRRYEDRRRCCTIADLRLEQPAVIRGKVVAMGVKTFRQRSKSVFELVLDDGTGRLHCRWWNQPYLERYYQEGSELLVYGRLIQLKPRTMDRPEVETVEDNDEAAIHLHRIVPVYPLTEGLSQRWLRTFLWRFIMEQPWRLPEPYPGLPLGGLPSRADALRWLHFPETNTAARLARNRLAFDEFFALQLTIQGRRKKMQAAARGLPCAGDNRWIKPWLAALGFKLTEAQARVLREIRRDLGGALPMRRLLQGDVGSGKTVVAGAAALMALESGRSVALMAPTEILAEQHYQTFQRWFGPLGIPVQLHTGSRKTTERNQMELAPASPAGPAAASSAPTAAPPPPGELYVGTHALITEDFAIGRLGLVVIDEQHKFGVVQREKLVRKGSYPHVLVMTATPIPRTLGLTLYGDLDVSVIDQSPAGRGRIQTHVREDSALPKVWEFIRQKLAEGRQAYVVYPLVEESEKVELKAVTAELQQLEQNLAPWRVGLLHGRLKAPEKDLLMRQFRENQVQILLATTVIEVGVDVPNATILLVENAERFGLAQLHQLRGRIGRGAHDAHCILVASARTPESRERLQILAESADGFRIAEADLALRGPGDFLGLQQSGLPPFRFGDLARDLKLIEFARQTAQDWLARPAPVAPLNPPGTD